MFEYRLRFIKEKNLKFLSHLELLRTTERALRRGKLPLAYSAGFHPHPQMSFGPALAVGISSSDEYFDLQLVRDFQPDQVKAVLNQTLPDGLRIIAVARISRHLKPLNAMINRASYSILLRTTPEDQSKVIQWMEGLLELPEFISRRITKDGQKLVNIRPWLHNLTTEVIETDLLKICFSGEIGSGGNLRPEDIVGNIPQPIEVLNIARTGLWHEEKGIITKPLDYC